MNPIEAPLSKMVWAEINLDDLKKQIRAFEQGDSYSLSVEYDAEHSLYVYRLKPNDVPPQIAAMAGDVVNNLRGTLDHLIWAIARMNVEHPFNRTCFPIYPEKITTWLNRRTGKTERRDNTREVGRVCQSLPPEAIDVVRAFQPYERGDDPFKDPLNVLNDLWNMDKHRTIIPIAASALLPLFGSHPGFSVRYLNDGTVIFHIPESANPKVNFEPHISFRVAFPPTSPGDGSPVADLLDDLYETVANDVVPAFAGFFPKDVPATKWIVSRRRSWTQ